MIDIQIQYNRYQNKINSNRKMSSNKHYNTYRKTNHNTKTYQNNIINSRLLDS